ncbi:ERCC4 domain containing protein [Aphelenchoides avenae]|nr:ERCC4 domain containing protein [Aphelenchus avenae]
MAAPTTAPNRVKRAKIQLQFPEKLFYEKVLADWNDNVFDKSKGHTIKSALQNLTRFPIEVHGYTDLRNIKGIGENIATRLDATWKFFVEQRFDGTAPTIDHVRDLQRGEALQYLENAPVSKGKAAVPFLKRRSKRANEGITGSAFGALSQPPAMTTSGTSRQQEDVQADEDAGLNTSFSQPAVPTYARSVSTAVPQPKPFLSPQKTSTITTFSLAQSVSTTVRSTPEHLLVYDPAKFDRCELVLIADGRERAGGGRASYKKMFDHLAKFGVTFETRALSVGDYLWVMRLDDGREMVMDYVIERKTWDDLKQSIRHARYAEQKKRLKDCGIPNVILVVEGGAAPDRALEQALATSAIENRFLVHRTNNAQGTAKFLKNLTERLKKRALTEHMVGQSFGYLQDESRKTKTITVSDCWLRQLTVCPMMSVERAQLVVERFPTLRALTEFYRQNRLSGTPVEPSDLLSNAIPQIPKSLSRQLAMFFASA